MSAARVALAAASASFSRPLTGWPWPSASEPMPIPQQSKPSETIFSSTSSRSVSVRAGMSRFGPRFLVAFAGRRFLVGRHHAGRSRGRCAKAAFLIPGKTGRKFHQHENHHLAPFIADRLGLPPGEGTTEFYPFGLSPFHSKEQYRRVRQSDSRIFSREMRKIGFSLLTTSWRRYTLCNAVGKTTLNYSFGRSVTFLH